MKRFATKHTIIFFSVLIVCCCCNTLSAQEYNCSFKDPIVKIDFGVAGDNNTYNLAGIKNYTKTYSSCPNDGYFSFVPSTNSCFDGRWYTLTADHTPGDVNGRMMVVNASEKPGYFFMIKVGGLKPNTRYRLSGWFVNICKYGTGCFPTPPEITIEVLANNKNIASFKTGKIEQTNAPLWRQYYGEFTMPADADAITIQMKDLTSGGCGNDFAMDDVFISECVLPQPEVIQKEKPKPVIVIAEPADKIVPPLKKLGNDSAQQQAAVPIPANKPTAAPAVIQKNISVAIPEVIETRANPIVKQILTEATELTIEVYDNGEIDGDTVSIYHNNELIVDHGAISATAITVKIKVDPQHPHHELVMVADNLGTIPPNTSLMIVTAGRKRYEVFISSTEKQNAKVVIDLQQ